MHNIIFSCSLSIQWFDDQLSRIGRRVDDGSDLLIRAIDETFGIPFQDLVTRFQTHLISRTGGQDPRHIRIKAAVKVTDFSASDEQPESS